jgi:hypothetical protein
MSGSGRRVLVLAQGFGGSGLARRYWSGFVLVLGKHGKARQGVARSEARRGEVTEGFHMW